MMISTSDILLSRARLTVRGIAATALALCLAGGLGATRAADDDWTKAETVTVVMTEYQFNPDHVVFRVGVPYRLHLVNKGKEMHEFTAAQFFKASVIRNPEVMARAGEDVVVQPGETKDVYLVAEKAGHYDLACADHDFEGMTGDILVK